jgi:hypothetical protein
MSSWTTTGHGTLWIAGRPDPRQDHAPNGRPVAPSPRSSVRCLLQGHPSTSAQRARSHHFLPILTQKVVASSSYFFGWGGARRDVRGSAGRWRGDRSLRRPEARRREPVYTANDQSRTPRNASPSRAPPQDRGEHEDGRGHTRKGERTQTRTRRARTSRWQAAHAKQRRSRARQRPTRAKRSPHAHAGERRPDSA